MESWQDRTIYFILIDRFRNGDKSNDDFGLGECDPKSEDGFHGGDLKGVIEKLPYIRGMGFDAIWLTPPVHNQWINPCTPTRGYHGYWAYDFTKIDPHFGTLEDYKTLVKEAHRLGLKVIQDIVVNHTGNYFTIDAASYDPQRPHKAWKELKAAVPPEGEPKAPRDPVFCMNNPNVPEHREAAVYNFTPAIADFKSREQTLTWALGDLDDINCRSPLAIKRLKEIYRYWIDEAGVDGFRVDTVYYTPEEFYDAFLHDEDGVKSFAKSRGKDDFFVFGEVWTYDYGAINAYLEGPKGPRLDSAIDIPLNETLTQIFYRKAATAGLNKALAARRRNRSLWVNFLDSHDTERMNSRASWPSVRQSLAALFTLPGIPCVYYGTEAGFKAVRQDMFADENFAEASKYRAFLEKLVAFRKEHPAFSRGRCRVEQSSAYSGVLSYRVKHGGAEYLVLFNTSTDRMVYAMRRKMEVLLSSEDIAPAEGVVVLAPNSYFVLRPVKGAAALEPKPALELLPVKRGAAGALTLGFRLERPEDVASVSLVADDDYDRKLTIWSFRSGRLELDASELGSGRHCLRLLAKTTAGAFLLSEAVPVTVRARYKLLAEAAELGTAGLAHRVQPPSDPSYDRQLQIEAAQAWSSGRDVRLKLRMANVTNEWNAPNGYDHVYFSVFFDFPGQPGKDFYPKLNLGGAGVKFNAGFLLYGWGALSFGAEDSTPDNYGGPLIGELAHAVDAKRRTIAFTFSRRYFDGLRSLSGLKIFVSTWDGYLGELRAIAPKPEQWNFSTLENVDPQSLPRVYDHAVLRLA